MHTPKKRFGQNFLIDPGVIANIISVIAPSSEENILEIGPGKGALTTKLIEHEANLEVVEVDNDLIQVLINKFGSHSNFKIYHQDILKFSFDNLNSGDKYKVIGNLPYNISTEVLFYLLKSIKRISTMVFMLQEEVVNRIVANPGSKTYGKLSVMLQYYCHAEKNFNVDSNCFYPAPKVMSAIVSLTPKQNPRRVNDENLLNKIVTKAFSMRRKTIRNSLSGLIESDELKSISIDSRCRAENLSLDDYINITNFITNKES